MWKKPKRRVPLPPRPGTPPLPRAAYEKSMVRRTIADELEEGQPRHHLLRRAARTPRAGRHNVMDIDSNLTICADQPGHRFEPTLCSGLTWTIGHDVAEKLGNWADKERRF